MFKKSNSPDTIFKDLCMKAKLSGDHLKQKTKNRVYTAPFSARLADMFCNLKLSFDSTSTQDEIMKSFHRHCGTKMPKSNGITFEDVYLDNDWNVMPKCRENDCYLRLPYKFNISTEDVVNPKN